MLTTILNEKADARELIENLKKLPPSKQEYVNGYVQGIADAIADRKEQQKTA